jgi:bifunctional ADP-heptose synthase (sugar kinase/adenylyltransferase)
MARIAVLGDAIHDIYLTGEVTRLSPEAPVPVLLNPEEEWTVGGAANVARHLDMMGHEASLYTLEPWPEKTRYRDWNGHHLLRMDIERAPDERRQCTLWAQVAQMLPTYDALVVSDYHKGSVPQEQSEIGWPWQNFVGLKVADAKRSFWRFSGFDAIKANAHAWNLEEDASVALVIRTLGADGCTELNSGNSWSGFKVPVADVTGAGDTFLAWLTHGLLLGQELETIMENCNRAASLAVQQRGTAVIASLT